MGGFVSGLKGVGSALGDVYDEFTGNTDPDTSDSDEISPSVRDAYLEVLHMAQHPEQHGVQSTAPNTQYVKMRAYTAPDAVKMRSMPGRTEGEPDESGMTNVRAPVRMMLHQPAPGTEGPPPQSVKMRATRQVGPYAVTQEGEGPNPGTTISPIPEHEIREAAAIRARTEYETARGRIAAEYARKLYNTAFRAEPPSAATIANVAATAALMDPVARHLLIAHPSLVPPHLAGHPALNPVPAAAGQEE